MPSTNDLSIVSQARAARYQARRLLAVAVQREKLSENLTHHGDYTRCSFAALSGDQQQIEGKRFVANERA